jgi:uncharacterized protein (TIGR02391 family)
MIAAGLLAPEPRQMGGHFVFLTRRAQAIRDSRAFEAFRKASILPRALLHPVIADRAWPNFIRGDHDTAVFQAFKEVEVAVRKAGGFGSQKIGVELVRAAFDPDAGPLADKSLPKGERESLSHLFAGAIGSYKNPSSHRTVVIKDVIEAARCLSSRAICCGSLMIGRRGLRRRRERRVLRLQLHKPQDHVAE